MGIIARIQTKSWWIGRSRRPLWFLLFVAIIVLLGGLVYIARSITATPSPKDSVAALSPAEVSSILLRSGVGVGDTTIDALYAPPWYFEWNERQPPTADKPVLVFFLFETIHDGVLESKLPTATLDVDGQRFEPVEVTLLSEAPHHRTSQVLFSALSENGIPLLNENTRHISLLLPVNGELSEDNTLSWALPLPFGAGAGNLGYRGLSWASLFAMLGGMLTALSPCLLQLTVYYAATLTGTSAEVAASPANLATARAKLLKTALFFVIGFTVVYTTGGAIAGYIGQSLQRMSNYSQWLRPIAIIAGIIILALAVRTAARARVPLVCRLSIGKHKLDQRSGVFGSILMGLSFAVGCLSCFSATVLSALLLYAGTSGSPITGAVLLLVFSLGIGLIFMLAALLIAQTLPWLTVLQRAQPIIGLISALIMAGFGVLMITDSFHIVSGFLSSLFRGG